LILQEIRKELEGIVGVDNVHEDYYDIPSIHLEQYADVGQFLRLLRLPKIIVRPSSLEEVVNIILFANRLKVPIVPMGGGTALFASGGALPQRAGTIIIDVRRLDKIIEIDEENLTLSAESGVTIDRVNMTLKKKGLWFPHHPESYRTATVGGAISTSGVGPFMTKYGRANDQVLKLTVVSPQGQVLEIGNKTAFDNAQRLREMYLSSEGSLGVIVNATVKIYKIPNARRIMMYGFQDIDSVCRAVKWIGDSGVLPEVLMIVEDVRLYNEGLSYLVGRSDIDVFRVLGDRKFYLLISLAGEPEILDTLEGVLHKTLTKLQNGSPLDERVVQTYWTHLTEIGAVVPPRVATTYRGYKYNSFRPGVPLGSLPQLYRIIQNASQVFKSAIYDGLVGYVRFPSLDVALAVGAYINENDVECVKEFLSLVKSLVDHTKSLGGTISAIVGLGKFLRNYAAIEHGDSLQVWKQILKLLDPGEIFGVY